MKSDAQIQKDVMDELRWEPLLSSADIAVAVKKGTVILSGQVDGYYKKVLAKNAVRKISGVKAIAVDIHIGISPVFKRTDAEIEDAILNILQWPIYVQEDKVKVEVENGIVRLEGEVDWEYQRRAAVSTVENLPGVKAVLNLIVVKPKIKAADIEKEISAAYQRHATLDARGIKAEVNGDTVVLKGSVRSFVEREDAEDAAWAAPGVISVDNKLQVNLPECVF